MIRSLTKCISLVTKQSKFEYYVLRSNRSLLTSSIQRYHQLNYISLFYPFSTAKFTPPPNANPMKEVDSKQLFNQFKKEISKITDKEKVIEKCVSVVNLMIDRDELRIAIEICDLGIELCENDPINQRPWLFFFQYQKCIFLHQLGYNIDAIEMAHSLRDTFTLFRQQFNEGDEELQDEYYLIYSVFKKIVKDVRQAKAYAKRYQQIIMKDEMKRQNPQLLFDSHYPLFDCCYSLGMRKAALSYAIVAAEQINRIEHKTMEMFHLLMAISWLFFQQGKFTESDFYQDLAMELLKQLKQNEDVSYYNKIKQDILEMRKQKALENEQEKGEVEVEEDLGEDLRRLGEYEEAIHFYLQKLEELRPESDSIQIISILNSMAETQFQTNNITKAIEVSQIAHGFLQNLTIENKTTNNLLLSNVSNLMLYYEQSQNYKEALDWGVKWYSLGKNMRLFDTYRVSIQLNMLILVSILKSLGKIQESIDYCKRLDDYVMKFQKEDPSIDFFNPRVHLINLLVKNKDFKQSLVLSADLYEMMKNRVEKSKILFILSTLITLSSQIEDDEKTILYSVEYLELLPSINTEDQYSFRRYQIEIALANIFRKKRDEKMADFYLQKCIETSQQLKDEDHQMQAYFTIGIIFFNQKKIEEAYQHISKAKILSDKLYANSSELNEYTELILKSLIQIYYLQNNFKNVLEQLDSYLAYSPKIDENQIKLYIYFLEQIQQQGQYRESAMTIAKKYNLSFH